MPRPRVPCTTTGGRLLDIPLALLVGLMALGAAAFAGAAPDAQERRGYEGPGPGMHPDLGVELTWPLAPVLVVLVVALAGRRVLPRTTYLAVVAATGAYLALGHPFGPVLLAPALSVHALASRYPLRTWLPWSVALVPMLLAAGLRQPYVGFLDPGTYASLVFGVVVCLFPAMFGVLRRARREADRRDRDVELVRAASEERLRVAREVHDVVGHSLAVISMQAGVALHVLDRRPDQVAASLEAIRRTSGDALTELRTTLEAFRDTESSSPRAPLPGLDRLDDLVAELRAVGRTVTLVDERELNERAPVPAAVDQAAYRIVQEALTNVVRHAGSAAVTVRIAREQDRLTIKVLDDGLVSAGEVSEGHGIVGMRERARALGGDLVAGPLDGGGFGVHADLPVPAPGDRDER